MKLIIVIIVSCLFVSCAKKDDAPPPNGLIHTIRGCDQLAPIYITTNNSCYILYYGDQTTADYCGTNPELHNKDYCTGLPKETQGSYF